MSFHGFTALECILDDVLFCSNQALLERCLIQEHAFVIRPCADCAFGPTSAPKSSAVYAVTPCRSEWEVEINVLVELDRFQGFVGKTLMLLCIFESMETI